MIIVCFVTRSAGNKLSKTKMGVHIIFSILPTDRRRFRERFKALFKITKCLFRVVVIDQIMLVRVKG